MTLIPTEALVQMVITEREQEARRLGLARAVALAQRCCEASAGFVERVLRAVGLRQSAPCEA